MNPPKVSVVIAALNEGENLVDTVRCIMRNSRYPQLEVIVVDDGSADGCGQRVRRQFGDGAGVVVLRAANLGVARARNHGAATAAGEVLIFLDAHCYTPPGWIEPLIAPLEDPRVGMVGPAFANLGDIDGPRGYGAMWTGPSLEIEWLARQGDDPYGVPLHPGACLAVRREDFEALGGYDAGMDRWGSECEELSLRYWLMGYDVVVQPRVVLHHLFRKRHPYPVESPQVIYNRLRMGLIHFSAGRLEALFDHYRRSPGFAQIVLRLFDSEVIGRRDDGQRQRRRNDEWFFARFAGAAQIPRQHRRRPRVNASLLQRSRVS